MVNREKAKRRTVLCSLYFTAFADLTFLYFGVLFGNGRKGIFGNLGCQLNFPGPNGGI